MQPLIKWPGGKTTEFTFIKNLIPEFKRYIEPFFGGGAVFFQLLPKQSIVNDINTDLVAFYKYTKDQDPEFKRQLYLYSDSWKKISDYINSFGGSLSLLYDHYKQKKINNSELTNNIGELINKSDHIFEKLFTADFYIDKKNLNRQITVNLVSKLKRMGKLEEKHGILPVTDIENNLETAFRSGFYMHFRDLMNNNTLKDQKKTANYYFVREFCYGSMFRFNKRGGFNIPYGGIAYNHKNIFSKVASIFSESTKQAFKNTRILNSDFESIFQQNDLSNSDFIFLDPPYDTNFSDYEKNIFDKSDQIRLANCLYKTKAKFLLIIKKTPFIHKLYKDQPNIKIESFEKKYLYNVRGRNERQVEHLIIYNY